MKIVSKIFSRSAVQNQIMLSI